MFTLVQEKGKIKKFTLTVEIRPHSHDACEMVERIEYLIKWPWLFPKLRDARYVKLLKAFFAYRHETILKDLEFSQEYDAPKRQRILISGAKGLVGRNLRIFLESMGHEVHSLTRKRTNNKWDVYFDDKTGEVDQEKLEGFDAIVHLRGKSVIGRWSLSKKKEMTRSRVDSTKKLAHILVLLRNPPKVFLCASATGFYGDRGREKLDEKSEPGQGAFLTELTMHWEEASKILIRNNIRVVHLRFGMIFSMSGGALLRMVWPIRFGLAGTLGDGKQYVSWIALDDAISAITHCIFRKEIAGPVNVVSPNPITNLELSKAIADYYHRPLGPKVHAGIIRLFTAEMGDELLLSSARCVPTVLINSGFRFRYPTIREALVRSLVPIDTK